MIEVEEHGALAYRRQNGCRCDICKAGNAAASRAFRAGHARTDERPTPFKKMPTWEALDYAPTLGEYMRMRASV